MRVPNHTQGWPGLGELIIVESTRYHGRLFYGICAPYIHPMCRSRCSVIAIVFKWKRAESGTRRGVGEEDTDLHYVSACDISQSVVVFIVPSFSLALPAIQKE